jgi:hypothetical protein
MSWLKRGRTKPYSNAGVRRSKCVRCGAEASATWQICADNNHYRAICTTCDIDLNGLVLRWANDPNAEEKIKKYRAKQLNKETP